MTMFVNKGDAPLTESQLHKRTQRFIHRDWPQWRRERDMRKGHPDFNQFMDGIEANTDVNRTNNLFNIQLQDYRAATERLSRYVLSEGRAAVYEDRETGEFDAETGEPIMARVRVQDAIKPLEPTVVVTVYDDEGVGTEETVPNPLIVADDAERAAAQGVVDATPADVQSWVE